MSTRILRAADRTPAPWKNGGGLTREVVTAPAGTDGFDWRVSLADVTADGPFSLFPGIDRTLTVVEGAGMDLVVGGEHHIVDEPLWPHDFPGDRPTDGFLLSGPVVNLNVMYRRGRTRAETAVVCGTVRLMAPPGGAVLALSLDDGALLGGAVLDGAELDGTDIRLDRYDAVLAEGGSPGVLRTMGQAVVITFSDV
ncbi:HutD family protein [Streptomyces cyaneofuscatus]|uniref:HutD family protein n=1 Tax=Streptomyces cyaneofuscatus TaxID=66883 RepID=A0ABZ1ESK4_9ACTN|nr:HutD family protein [Streptomyces cyaneofuscatus]WSB07105.1 HutD family protein [Streptomyces cyaneofuscatus]WSD49360.1 HutD family protein [Streptomyces cyaneofuscatus]WTA92778.1 HutD family protein [Streptomyces cyaneofuscatus]